MADRDLGSFLTNIQGVLAIGGAMAALPLFLALADLAPPWPPAIGGVSAALVLVTSLVVWEFTASARVKNRRRWILLSLLLVLLGLGAYLTLYSLWVEPVPGSDLRVVRGFECNADARLVYKGQCPDLPREALESAEWEAVALWTRQSVTLARLGLVGAWLLFTAGLMAVVSAVVAGRKVSLPKAD